MNIVDALSKYKRIRLPEFPSDFYLSVDDDDNLATPNGNGYNPSRGELISENWEGELTEEEQHAKYLEGRKLAIQKRLKSGGKFVIYEMNKPYGCVNSVTYEVVAEPRLNDPEETTKIIVGEFTELEYAKLFYDAMQLNYSENE